MDIKRSGTQPSGRGDAEHFTGARSRHCRHLRAGRPDSLAQPPAGPDAGCDGWLQRWGDSIVEIRPGDVIWTPPGKKRWHGAAPATAVTHMAIQEQLEGKTADWMEKVSDDQYDG